MDVESAGGWSKEGEGISKTDCETGLHGKTLGDFEGDHSASQSRGKREQMTRHIHAREELSRFVGDHCCKHPLTHPLNYALTTLTINSSGSSGNN